MADAICRRSNERSGLARPATGGRLAARRFLALAYSAILATALAWSLWLFVLRNLPASIAGLSTLAVPVCGVLFSWWLLHENPGKVEGCGIALIVLALAMISIKRRGA